jgi:hypothetical protein
VGHQSYSDSALNPPIILLDHQSALGYGDSAFNPSRWGVPHFRACATTRSRRTFVGFQQVSEAGKSPTSRGEIRQHAIAGVQAIDRMHCHRNPGADFLAVGGWFRARLRRKLTNWLYVPAINDAYDLPRNFLSEPTNPSRGMLATLSEFNTAPPDAAIDFGALAKEFRSSGISEMDRLWAKPRATYRQQCAAAESLAGAAKRLDPKQRADLIYDLVIRLPFALAHGHLLKNEYASHVLSRCLWSLVIGSAYGEKGYTPHLKKRLDRIIDVIIWLRRHTAPKDKHLSIVLTLGTEFVIESQFFHIPDSGIQGVIRLYELLDETLDPVDFEENGWFELYRYCKALKLSKKTSRLDRFGENMDQLVDAYRTVLASASDERIAAALFSNDRDEIRNTAKDLFATEGVAAFDKYLAAWNLRPSPVGSSRNEDPQSRLRVRLETDMRRAWKEMPSIIKWLYEQPLQWTDPQRAALIRSMARRDGFPHPAFVLQSLEVCRNGGHPETYKALKGMRTAQQHGSPEAYLDMLEGLKPMLLTLDVIRFANVALGRLGPA